MKSFKYIATLAVAAAGVATQADAIPITYSYTGANFTFGTGPAGFTTNDNITASFTVNKPLAPDMNLCPDWWPELLWRLHFPLKFPGEIPRPGPVNYPCTGKRASMIDEITLCLFAPRQANGDPRGCRCISSTDHEGLQFWVAAEELMARLLPPSKTLVFSSPANEPTVKPGAR